MCNNITCWCITSIMDMFFYGALLLWYLNNQLLGIMHECFMLEDACIESLGPLMLELSVQLSYEFVKGGTETYPTPNVSVLLVDMKHIDGQFIKFYLSLSFINSHCPLYASQMTEKEKRGK
ncbi:hypothetical protein ACJX0J_030821 [Zea mays]